MATECIYGKYEGDQNVSEEVLYSLYYFTSFNEISHNATLMCL